jgi:molybdate/tungstate transport system substrate-binding protein
MKRRVSLLFKNFDRNSIIIPLIKRCTGCAAAINKCKFKIGHGWPILLIAVFWVLILFIQCEDKKSSESRDGIAGDLIVFHAGSLAVPFKQIAEEFNQEYPDVNVMMEAAGSRDCARKITDLGRDCDVMASADYKVIDNLLIPEYADWNIKFAANEMIIAYHEASRKSEEINSRNWYNILLDEDVCFGRSNPDADPCGYRSVLTIKLAELYYQEEGLTEKMINKDTIYIRPKEVDLLALLETNTIDYFFIYRSVAEQHGLKYLILPDEINLKSADFADYYSQVSIQVSGKEPGEYITHTGAPMVYGITIIKNSPNPAAALAFVRFVLDKEKGLRIMEENGQPGVVPASTETYEGISEELKEYAKE